MKKREQIISVRKRETKEVLIQIPSDTLVALKKVAASKAMSEQALMKFYLGQGLRQDLARLFSDRVLETTQKVLSKHLKSEDEISKIMREIRGEEAA